MTTLRRIIVMLATAALLAGCAAERLHREGLAAVERGDYESGISKLDAAAKSDPHNMGYRLDLAARRDSSAQNLIVLGDSERAAGKLDAAGLAYQRVLGIDPNNDRARRGLTGLGSDARHAATVVEARKDLERKDYDAADTKIRQVLVEDPGYKPAQELNSAITIARGPTTVAPRLKTRDNRKVTLQFRDAPTKMVFEVLSRETGINFILDKDIKSDGKTTIFVQDVPVEDAIDLVLQQNSLTRQILAANMVLIYPNNSTKQKEYQEEIVRTFYVTNAAPKDVEGMLKTVLGAKTLFIDERAGVVVMRDIPDAIRMAEKLVASLDVAEPEVMLEVEVLEIQKSRLQDLGIAYPTSATLAPSALATGAKATSGLVLSDLSHQNSHTISVSPLSLTLNALKQAGLTNTLASPRIRARNREKAKILIGQREPVITNSVTPTAAGTPVVTGSVQYLDVGLTLEVQPTIYLDSDVAIKVNLEVSSILKQITTASGTIAYEIGTRNANTLLRLKDGETQILAGLIQDTDTRTANSIPGLGDIPIIGRLFGTTHSDVEKDEIVLSITPRIIRMQPRPASETAEFWYGTENRTRTAPFSQSPAASPHAGIAGPTSGSTMVGDPAVERPLPAANLSMPAAVSPSVLASALQGAPLGTPPASLKPSSAQSSAAPASGGSGDVERHGQTASTVSPAARSALTIEAPGEVRVGEEFQVVIRVSTESITRLRSQLRFDPTAVQLISANAGEMVPAAAGGPQVSVLPGGAQLDVSTTADDPVHGDGALMVLRFKALGPRPGTSVAAMLSVIGSNGAAVSNGSAPPATIVIQP